MSLDISKLSMVRPINQYPSSMNCAGDYVYTLHEENMNLRRKLSVYEHAFAQIFKVPLAEVVVSELYTTPQFDTQWSVAVNVPAYTVTTTLGMLSMMQASDANTREFIDRVADRRSLIPDLTRKILSEVTRPTNAIHSTVRNPNVKPSDKNNR